MNNEITKDYVKLHSEIIQEILSLNMHCQFNDDIEQEYVYIFECEDEISFNRFRSESYCRNIIYQDLYKWRQLVQIAEENNRLWQMYKKEFSIILSSRKYIPQDEKSEFQKFEDMLVDELKFLRPITEPAIRIKANYLSEKTNKLLIKEKVIDYFLLKSIMPYMQWTGEDSPANSYEIILKNHIISQNFVKYKIDYIKGLTPFEFESWISALFNSCGYNSYTTKKSGDYGVDVIAENENKRIAIQCKLTKSTLGIRCVQEVIAGAEYYRADEGWVISTCPSFTYQAFELANSCNVKLFNIEELEMLLNSLINPTI